MLDDEKPTKRMTKISPAPTFALARNSLVTPTRDGFVIKIGERSLELTKREALDLTIELMGTAHRR